MIGDRVSHSGAMDRRDFLISAPILVAAAAGLGGAAACAPRRSRRILLLGGTGFVGPHLVRAALARGHEVTLFNRGVTNPGLFPELEHLRGNRYPDRDVGLSALAGDRTWDAVIDTWQAEPGCVDVTARLLAERTGRYLYVSSIATYRDYREAGMTEEGPFLDAREHVGSFDPELGYPTRKRAGEQAVQAVYGDRGTVLLCTSIQGPSDAADAGSAVGYWTYRFLMGEPLLAPDDPTAFIQLIDVRDMAEFALRAIEDDLAGAYNMVGPEEPLTLPSYLRGWSEATGHRSTIIWADPAWLRARGVRPWDHVANWIPGDDPEPGFYRISNRRALAHGLTYRPLLDTLRDGIAGVEVIDETQALGGGLSRRRELELIDAWRSERE